MHENHCARECVNYSLVRRGDGLKLAEVLKDVGGVLLDLEELSDSDDPEVRVLLHLPLKLCIVHSLWPYILGSSFQKLGWCAGNKVHKHKPSCIILCDLFQIILHRCVLLFVRS